jgi:hypothetical protein
MCCVRVCQHGRAVSEAAPHLDKMNAPQQALKGRDRRTCAAACAGQERRRTRPLSRARRCGSSRARAPTRGAGSASTTAAWSPGTRATWSATASAAGRPRSTRSRTPRPGPCRRARTPQLVRVGWSIGYEAGFSWLLTRDVGEQCPGAPMRQRTVRMIMGPLNPAGRQAARSRTRRAAAWGQAPGPVRLCCLFAAARKSRVPSMAWSPMLALARRPPPTITRGDMRAPVHCRAGVRPAQLGVHAVLRARRSAGAGRAPARRGGRRGRPRPKRRARPRRGRRAGGRRPAVRGAGRSQKRVRGCCALACL